MTPGAQEPAPDGAWYIPTLSYRLSRVASFPIPAIPIQSRPLEPDTVEAVLWRSRQLLHRGLALAGRREDGCLR